MKQQISIKKILLFLFVTITIPSFSQYYVTYGGVCYKLAVGPNTASVVAGRPNEKIMYSGYINIYESISETVWTGKSSEYIKFTVTDISGDAFTNCKDITSVYIPKTIKAIPSGTFSGCSSLSSIKVNSNNSKYDSRDGCNAVIETSTNTLIAGCKNTVIPNSIESINSDAFHNCEGLVSINIPKNVTNIKDNSNPFYGCINLASITVDAENKVFDSRNDCNAIINTSKNELIVGCNNTKIPLDISSIGYKAFGGLSELLGIEIPDNITNICSCAFENSGLKSLTVPAGIKCISNSAFEGCSLLSSVTIMEGVKEIGESTFKNCGSLNEIQLPHSMESIHDYAFQGCKSMLSIDLNAVSRIEQSVFAECNLKKVSFNYDFTFYKRNGKSYQAVGTPQFQEIFGEQVEELIIGDNVNKLNYSFSGCNNLKAISINFELIKPWFRNMQTITTVNLGKNVSKIDDDAFCGCTGITSIELPQNLRHIGKGAFTNCQMTNMVIPEKVDTIGAFAFSNCTQLTKVILSGCNLKYIGDEAFSQCSISDIEIPDGVKKIGKLAFGGCKKLVNVSMPNSVDILGVSAFSGCESLQNVTLSESLKRLNDNLFSGCSSITSINLPNNLTAIGVSSFDGCNSLQEVNLPNSITSIGNKAFANCSSIASINIPSSLKSIGTDAFKGCGKLQKVFVSDLAAWCGITFDGYDGSNNPLSIAHHLYNEDGTEITDLVIPDGVANINSYAFYGGSSLTSVTVPGSLKKIGSRAFDGCSGLTKVTISDLAAWCKMTFTDNPLRYAQRLYDADGTEIQDLTIPTGIEGISNKAFAGCSSLKSLVIPNGVEYIGYDAFYGCQNLATVVIPNSVKEIGSDAFADCMSLYSVTSLVNMPFKLNESAFAYTGYDYDKDIIYNIAKLYVPTGRSAVYGATTGWKKFMNIMEIDTKFKLTYIVDGTEYKTYEVQATEVVTPEPDPYKEGYVFSGWSRIPSIMPAENVTVYGSFAVDPNYAGIDWVTDNETKPKAYYSVDGKRLETEQKGLNIIRMSDGTTRKVVVK